MNIAKFFNSGDTSSEAILSQAADNHVPEGATTIPVGGVELSGSKWEPPHVGEDIVWSANIIHKLQQVLTGTGLGFAPQVEHNVAFISGDEDLIDLVTKPDPCFVKVKPSAAPEDDAVCRVKYPKYLVNYSFEEEASKFLMAYGKEGELVKTFTEEDLQRNEDGTWAHYKHDLHWSLAEMVHKVPREKLHNKRDRGAAKVGNFSCFPAHTRITTNKGEKDIVNVTLVDLLWDGLAWVSHEGVQYQGERYTIEYAGFRATPDHVVWLEDGRESCFGDAALEDADIARSHSGCVVLQQRHTSSSQEDQIEHQRQLYKRVDEEGSVGIRARSAFKHFKLKVEKVYDIINAGPRHRFTAEGYLVSNSAYGAVGATLERKIESDTGVKPAEGTGEALLQALAERQPRATAYLLSMEDIPETPGYITAASGRTRHFHLHDQKLYGIKSRTHQGMLSAMGRECRNFPMQESVASTAARAGVWLLEFGRKNGLQGSPMTILYDAVVTNCPEEEREIWSKAHDVFMFLKNGWSYHGRILTYPIDTELNQAWSWKPSKERLAQLQDPNFKPTPERFQHLLKGLDAMIEVYSAAPNLALRD